MRLFRFCFPVRWVTDGNRIMRNDTLAKASHTKSDADYLEEYRRSGSETAFRALVARYWSPIYSSCYRRLGRNRSEAEEACQSVFVVLAEKTRQLSPRTELLGWLMTAARYVCVDMIRARDRRRTHERASADMRDRQTDESEAWEEAKGLLDDMVDTLPGRQRQAVQLYFFGRQTQADIARQLGTNEDTVRKRIKTGVEKLRARLTRRGISFSAATFVGFLQTGTIETGAAGLADGICATALACAKGGAPATGSATVLSAAKGGMKLWFWAKVKFVSLVAAPALLVAGSVAGVASARLPAAKPADRITKPTARWNNGLPQDPKFFPVGVWLQSARNAGPLRKLGINFYLGLTGDPAKGLAQLQRHEMLAICGRDQMAGDLATNKSLVGWMLPDQPDGAKSIKEHWGGNLDRIRQAWPDMNQKAEIRWGVPIPPRDVMADYEAVQAEDPTRPVLANFGLGVALDSWGGRGDRAGKSEDYREYAKCADILSFCIYAIKPDKGGSNTVRLWHIGHGVRRLKRWTGSDKSVWTLLQASRINEEHHLPTRALLRAQAWMAIIHGANGIVWYVHQLKPRFIETTPLANPAFGKSLADVNREIHALAEVLNGPTADGTVVVSNMPNTVSADLRKAMGTTPVATMVKQYRDRLYVFAVRMENSPCESTFRLKGVAAKARIDVLEEDRTISIRNGRFKDRFSAWDVHLYRIRLK